MVVNYHIALSRIISVVDGCSYDFCVTVVFTIVAHVIVVLTGANYRQIDRIVKLSDFGLSRPMFESDYNRFSKIGKEISIGMFHVRWISPESCSDGIYSLMSEIQSYRVLLYETSLLVNFHTLKLFQKPKNPHFF